MSMTLKEARLKVFYNSLARIKLTRDYNLSNPNVYAGTKTQKASHDICVLAFNKIHGLINSFPLPIDLASPVVYENAMHRPTTSHVVVTYYAGDMFVRLRAEHFPKTGDVLLETVTVYDPLYNLVVYVDVSGINGLPMRQYTYGAGTVQGFCDILAQRIDKHREKMMNAADAYLLTFTNIGVP